LQHQQPPAELLKDLTAFEAVLSKWRAVFAQVRDGAGEPDAKARGLADAGLSDASRCHEQLLESLLLPYARKVLAAGEVSPQRQEIAGLHSFGCLYQQAEESGAAANIAADLIAAMSAAGGGSAQDSDVGSNRWRVKCANGFCPDAFVVVRTESHVYTTRSATYEGGHRCRFSFDEWNCNFGVVRTADGAVLFARSYSHQAEPEPPFILTSFGGEPFPTEEHETSDGEHIVAGRARDAILGVGIPLATPAPPTPPAPPDAPPEPGSEPPPPPTVD
jgi:hypothetical protein